MLPIEREILEKAWNDFQRIKRLPHYTVKEEAELLQDITQLLGLYDIHFTRKIYDMLVEMIRYGESRGSHFIIPKIEMQKIHQKHTKK